MSADSVGAAPTRESKTRRKQAMHDLQALGEALVDVEPRRLAELDLPETLADAIGQARRITAHEGRRRQMQYVGRLMRDVDPEPIRAALDRRNEVPRAQKARFAALETWRTRLLEDPSAIDRFVSEHPAADRVELARAIAAARQGAEGSSAPRAARELFRLLRRVSGQD
ncbi:MAG: ribosome biogenesis factor YjgA [Burkholderiales bacterium]